MRVTASGVKGGRAGCGARWHGQSRAGTRRHARNAKPCASGAGKSAATFTLTLRRRRRGGRLQVAQSEAVQTDSEAYWRSLGRKTALVTGAAGGVGFALADALAKRGFSVVICDIDEGRIRAAEEALNALYGSGSAYATVCDVGDSSSVDSLASFAQDKLGDVDIWINNAGRNGGKIPLWEQTPENLAGVVGCNLMGVLLCTRAAINVMKVQKNGRRAHIFNVTGSGVKGEATPGWSAYGATKRGMPQFTQSILKEMDKYGGVENVSLHTMSPGMVFTDMLLSDATPNERKFFDILADEPEQVGEELIEKVLPIAATTDTGANIQYLDTPRILQRILSVDLLKFLAGLAFPQLKLAPGKRIDADGNRIRREGEEYRKNGVKVLFKGMEERKSGL
ncbi:chlorophyll b reductase [Chloropicon primus]|uniref:Chlorophyll b reductase n=1 Tax=Chloropicon primus TaxID=1764295 RepID=A0A5B8MU44_9CHLO|nr:chlorophyll b reductase [Chloropicon primus]|eukprot:QDZ23887.1 chlorophyll b reductase [Chloropicon primus]